jgi:hypothetical protein
MTKYLDHYKLSERDIARCTCIGCGTNVITQGDYCMLSDSIWNQQLKLSWDDNLCVACIEKRLGRALSFLDFISFPMVEGYPTSKVLLARLGGETEPPKRKKRKRARA